MINKQTFQLLMKKGIEVKQCRRIEMDAKVYLLSISWMHTNREINMDVLLAFFENEIYIAMDSLEGNYYYTENLRYEISAILEDIQTDIAKLPIYRFHFLYKKVEVKISPSYIISDINRYKKRINEEGYIEKEVERLVRDVSKAMENMNLPLYQKSDVYFQRIVLYGSDGIRLAKLLEDKRIVKSLYQRSVNFPNVVCQFRWAGIESAKHNREEEMVKMWYRFLRKYQYACEIIFNEY